MPYRILFFLLLLSATPAHALLQPEEIAIITAKGSRESQQLAAYYCKVRGVPPANICPVVVPKGEVLSHEDWAFGVRPAIAKWLAANDPDRKLRCLVTTWDVPLKIAAAPVDAHLTGYREFLEAERKHRIELIGQITGQLDSLGGGSPLSAAINAIETDAPDLAALQASLEAALQSAQARLATGSTEQRQQNLARVQQLATVAGGTRVLLGSLEKELQKPNPPEQLRNQFELLRGRAAGIEEVRGLMEQMPAGPERDALVLAALERIGGLLATIGWLDTQLETVRKNETGASFDSELALVLWPEGYELLRWQPNYLRPAYDHSQLRLVYPTLMVARLDGPTLPIVKQLIDTAIRIEQEGGLKGKVYIDARGLAKPDATGLSPGSYPDYDQSLLVTAKGIKEQTELEVVLNDKPELFQSGECPQAALYCGWYSLSKYVDAFEWNPGAVAYHLASGEASTLRDPKSEVWCKRLLEDGVCATIGPVYEPYLVAYPRPDEFFARLLAGEETLAEVYARTKPFNSWMMTLVGDPLYRPFVKPDQTTEQDQP